MKPPFLNGVPGTLFKLSNQHLPWQDYFKLSNFRLFPS